MTIRRYIYFWLHFILGYAFPVVYFISKWGITKNAKTFVMPVIFLSLVAIIKLCVSIPAWVATWRPSFLKGLVRSIPIYLLFICLTTFGLTFKYLLEHQINIAFTLYFEVVFVIFGALSLSSVFDALHIKYKELDMMAKGYTLGVIR